MFQKASRSQVFVKVALTGPSGSGKTLSALRMAAGLVADTGKPIALIDTENDSASLYSDMTPEQCKAFGIPQAISFDVCGIAPPFAASEFERLVKVAMNDNYGVVVIDSASHLWKGILAYKGDIDARGGNQWTNWRDPDKKFQDAIDSVLQSKIHVIFCMRSKTEYILEDNGKGKQAPRKVGLAPIMKEGLEFEFSAVLDIQMDHKAQASKDRTGLFPTDRIFQITEDTGRELHSWLKTATPKPEPPPMASTPEELHTQTVGVFRKRLAKISAECNVDAEGLKPALNDLEVAFCAIAAAMCEDNRTREKLEDFTLAELREIWAKDKGKIPFERVKNQANGITA